MPLLRHFNLTLRCTYWAAIGRFPFGDHSAISRWKHHFQLDDTLKPTMPRCAPCCRHAVTSTAPVITGADTLHEDLERGSKSHDTFINLQKDYIDLTFDLLGDGPTAPVGAAAISDFLRMAN